MVIIIDIKSSIGPSNISRGPLPVKLSQKQRLIPGAIAKVESLQNSICQRSLAKLFASLRLRSYSMEHL